MTEGLAKLPADLRAIAERFLSTYGAAETEYTVRYNPRDDMGFELLWGKDKVKPLARLTWWRPSTGGGWYVVAPVEFDLRSDYDGPFPPHPGFAEYLQEIGAPHPLLAGLTAVGEAAVVSLLEAHGAAPKSVASIEEQFRACPEYEGPDVPRARWEVEVSWGDRRSDHASALMVMEDGGPSYVGLSWSTKDEVSLGFVPVEAGKVTFRKVQRSEDFAAFLKRFA